MNRHAVAYPAINQGGAQISEKPFKAVRPFLGGSGVFASENFEKMNIKWCDYVVGLPGT